jgi:hypothetical protein
MTISFPRTDILSGVEIADQVFRLAHRHELSRTATGATRAKELGPSLWAGDWTTAPLENDAAIEFEAKLASLDGPINTFRGGDVRRIYPRAYSTGAFTDGAGLEAVDPANLHRIKLHTLDAGFTLSVGDFLAFTYGTLRALHQVMEAATADGLGTTPYFEVRPAIRPGYVIPSAVTLKRPEADFRLLPGSVEARPQGALHTVVSFKAMQAL